MLAEESIVEEFNLFKEFDIVFNNLRYKGTIETSETRRYADIYWEINAGVPSDGMDTIYPGRMSHVNGGNLWLRIFNNAQPRRMTEDEANAAISKRLQKIERLLAECKLVADKSNVEFHFIKEI